MSRRTSVRRPGEVLSVALRLANRDFHRDRIVAELLRDDQVLELQRMAGVDRARAFALHTADVALLRVRSSPRDDWPTQVPVRVAELRMRADSIPWPGRAGATDRRALEAAYFTASKARSTTFNLSARMWALRAGLGRGDGTGWRTVLHAVHRLEERGALSIEKKANRGHAAIANLYKLRVASSGTGSTPEVPLYQNSPPLPEGIGDWAYLAHDAFRPNALGDVGWLMLRWLDRTRPILVPQIVAATGAERHRVYRTLGALQASGIAGKCPDGWIPQATDDLLLARLDEVAARAGTSGQLARDQHAYREQWDSFARDLKKRKDRSLSVPELATAAADLAALEGGLADLIIRERVPGEAIA